MHISNRRKKMKPSVEIRKVSTNPDEIGKPSKVYESANLEVFDLNKDDVLSVSNDLPWDDE